MARATGYSFKCYQCHKYWRINAEGCTSDGTSIVDVLQVHNLECDGMTPNEREAQRAIDSMGETSA